MQAENGKLITGNISLAEFWSERYFSEYVKSGGSKIKFVTGRTGSGKSYFLREVSDLAVQQDYITVCFSARDIWLHDFKEVYAEIFEQSNILECLRGCADQIVCNMGFEPQEIPEGQTFVDYLAQQDLADALTKREIRTQLKELFLDNPMLDNNFALACSMLTGSLLGHPILEKQNQEILLSWMSGDRTVKLSLLRALGLSPARITKYNARHMLRSLAAVIHMGGHAGLAVLIDDMDVLLNNAGLENIRYTKMKREDTYENIRQLIDDIDSMKYVMFVYAFDRSMMDDEKNGLKSYQALWMRIQNEVVGQKFNFFADVVDMDRMEQQIYTEHGLIELSRRMLADTGAGRPEPINIETAKIILDQTRFGAVGIPGMVYQAMTGGIKYV